MQGMPRPRFRRKRSPKARRRLPNARGHAARLPHAAPQVRGRYRSVLSRRPVRDARAAHRLEQRRDGQHHRPQRGGSTRSHRVPPDPLMRASSIAIALVLCLAADEGAVLAGSIGPNSPRSSEVTSVAGRASGRAAPEPKVAPVELKVEVEAVDPNRLLLTLRRNGYLVALRAEGHASAAVDWVSAEIANAPADRLGLTGGTTRQSPPGT